MNLLKIDDRRGSIEYLKPLRRLRLPARRRRLIAGDVVFRGYGPEDSIVKVGVEIKKPGELLQAFLSKRLQGFQLPRMVRNGQRFIFLVIDGAYRPSLGGMIETWRTIQTRRNGFTMGMWGQAYSRVTYDQLEKFLFTLQFRCGIYVMKSSGPQETTQLLQSLYLWWQKPWSKHRSMLATPAFIPRGRRGLWLTKPNLVKLWADRLTGIGWEKSEMCARVFSNARQMANASVKDWMMVPGIGKTLAMRVENEIGGRVAPFRR